MSTVLNKYFAISDIHSFFDEMLYALKLKGFDLSNNSHYVILCGDAFDRGPDSNKVFNFLKDLYAQNRLIYIRGNHEDLLFDCIKELTSTGKISGHHYHNGTVKTLSHFIDEDDFWMYSTYIPSSVINKIVENTSELQKFILDACVDSFELGNKIFVHSWIPTEQQTWKEARWGNPFELWKQKLYPEDKCIVAGHWHTSWYWSHIKLERKEWPQKNREGWQNAFDPVVEENIIGLDACTAYSGKVNCMVFDSTGTLLD